MHTSIDLRYQPRVANTKRPIHTYKETYTHTQRDLTSIDLRSITAMRNSCFLCVSLVSHASFVVSHDSDYYSYCTSIDLRSISAISDSWPIVSIDICMCVIIRDMTHVCHVCHSWPIVSLDICTYTQESCL